MITAKTAHALRILNDVVVERPRQFGLLFWGRDHPGWQRNTRCGHGTSRGGGMNLAAGGYLGKLRKQGLVYELSGAAIKRWVLTPAGRAALADYQEHVQP